MVIFCSRKKAFMTFVGLARTQFLETGPLWCCFLVPENTNERQVKSSTSMAPDIKRMEKNRENLLILELTTALLILVCCSLRKLGVTNCQYNPFIQVLLNVVDSAEVMTDQ